MSETDRQGHSQVTLQDIITKQGESGDRGGVGGGGRGVYAQTHT